MRTPIRRRAATVLATTLALLAMAVHVALSSVHIVSVASAALETGATGNPFAQVMCLNTGLGQPQQGDAGPGQGEQEGTQGPGSGHVSLCGHCAVGAGGCALSSTDRAPLANPVLVNLAVLGHVGQSDGSGKLNVANLRSRGPPRLKLLLSA